MGSRGRPEESRAAILSAAVTEFSREGPAGARTDAIARAAKVNKALLYYYFKDKESLHGAVLDQVFGGLWVAVQDVLSRDLPPREKILAYAGAHFDYIASHPLYPRIAQSEMMTASRGKPVHLERIVTKYFRPLFLSVAEVLQSRNRFRRFPAGRSLAIYSVYDFCNCVLFHQCPGYAIDERC